MHKIENDNNSELCYEEGTLSTSNEARGSDDLLNEHYKYGSIYNGDWSEKHNNEGNLLALGD